MKMKNKKEVEDEKRRLIKEQRKKEKRERIKTSNSLERSEEELEIRPSILIVCEGQVTEPSYFEQFRLTTATVEIVGKGFNTTSLVKEALNIKNTSKVQYTDIWCVFDKDDFPNNDFDNAIALANSYGFKVAYSNQAFEYWLLLHLNNHQGGAINRNDYTRMLNNGLKPFGLTYGTNNKKVVTDEIFEIFLAEEPSCQNKKRIDLAIERAEKITNNYDAVGTPHSSRCSGTTVHTLVKKILNYTK